MIYGVGTDIVEIARVKRVIDKSERFLERFYSEKEQELIAGRKRRVETAAMNFAGKEAVAKAFRTGFTKGVAMEEIQILRDKDGAPVVKLLGRTKAFAKERGIEAIHISLSDTKELAMAYVVAETGGEKCE